jgi:thiol:disulfide interchange protein
MKRHLFTGLTILTLLGQGCPVVQTVAEPPVQPATPIAPTADTSAPDTVTPPETQPSVYEPFTLAAFNDARAAGEPIYLFFYANWCPFCKEQEPRNQIVFRDFTGGTVHGFRVDYNDPNTDADEKALAEQFRVSYQHTAVYLNADGKEVKRVLGKQTNEALANDLKIIAR